MINKKRGISDTIRDVRRLYKLTQAEFCRLYNNYPPFAVRITRSVLARYETGAIMPTAVKYNKFLMLGELKDKE